MIQYVPGIHDVTRINRVHLFATRTSVGISRIHYTTLFIVSLHYITVYKLLPTSIIHQWMDQWMRNSQQNIISKMDSPLDGQEKQDGEQVLFDINFDIYIYILYY